VPVAFSLTDSTLAALSEIDRALGRLEGLSVRHPQPRLRRRNRVRSVHASAQIEGNSLSLEQVTAVLEGTRVVGAPKDVREIVNANAAYARLATWQPHQLKSLLSAHSVLMDGLVSDAGRFRSGGVGVFRGRQLKHLAPPPHLVRHHVDGLLRWLSRTDTPSLIAGCVVHYELLFIHPFTDGNGRVSRLWQQVIHRRHDPLLEFVPVETVVRDRQRAYYRALEASDRRADCTPFIEFSLRALADALEEFGREVKVSPERSEARLERAAAELGSRWFTRLDYLKLQPRLSTASASRDLADGVKRKVLSRRGERRLTEYRFRAR
jgi:Fic family protein